MGAATVADVVVDGLLWGGAKHLFVGRDVARSSLLVEAARPRALGVVPVSAAGLIAAVTGELTGAPGAALVSAAPGAALVSAGEQAAAAAYAAANRAPVILLAVRGADAQARVPGADAQARAPDADARIRAGAPWAGRHIVLEPDSAAQGIARAVKCALGPRPGPVRVDVAAEVLPQPASSLATDIRRPSSLPPPDRRALDDAARLLGSAERPVLILGLECRSGDAPAWLRPFAEALPAPVLVTPKAKGVLPDSHPLVLGLLGGPGSDALLERADLIVAIGLDPAEGSGWIPARSVLRLGTAGDPTLCAKGATPPNTRQRPGTPAVEVAGEIGLILAELAPRLRTQRGANWDVAEIDRFKRSRMAWQQAPAAGLTVRRVVHVARELSPAGTVAAVDPGPWAGAAAESWSVLAPGEFLFPIADRLLGDRPLSFAPAAALAACLARPGQPAIGLMPLEALASASGELETVARLAVPVVLVAWEGETEEPPGARPGAGARTAARAKTAGGQPAPLQLARDLGMTVVAAQSEAELVAALGQALQAKAPGLVAVRVQSPG